MKMSKTDYAELKESMSKTIQKARAEYPDTYATEMIRDKVKLAWDIFHLALRWEFLTEKQFNRFYTYIQDSHLETAIKRAFRELN